MLTDEQLDDRLRKREAIRAEVAELQLKRDGIGPLEALIADSHSRVEVASDQHQGVCRPLQDELKKLERQAVERVSNRLLPDPEADDRRRELITELASHNAELEQVVEVEKTYRQPLERKLWTLKNEVTDPEAIRARLAGHSVASPRLLIQRHINQQRTQFVGIRLKHAKQMVKIAKYNLDGVRSRKFSGSLATYEQKVEFAEAELGAALEEQAAALDEGKRIHEEILSE